MPTVLRKNGYRFFFYSHEPNEPPHIHVEKSEGEAKLWLTPMSLADNDGFSAREIEKIMAIVLENLDYLVQRYREFHGLRTEHRREKGKR